MASSPPELISTRTAVVLLLAAVVGLLVGFLSYIADASLPRALILSALAGLAATVPINKLIGQ